MPHKHALERIGVCVHRAHRFPDEFRFQSISKFVIYRLQQPYRFYFDLPIITLSIYAQA